MRALRLMVVAFFATFLGATCEQPPPHEVVVVCAGGEEAGVPEPFDADTSSEALGLSTVCARACKNFAVLGCPEAWKLPAGRTCVETCKAIAPISKFDPLCVEKAKDVVAVRKCPQISCKKD